MPHCTIIPHLEVWNVPAFVVDSAMLTLGGYTGNAYLWVAMLLGVFWLGMAWSGFKTLDDRRWAWRLFVFSLVDIAVLSLMMAVDPAAF